MYWGTKLRSVQLVVIAAIIAGCTARLADVTHYRLIGGAAALIAAAIVLVRKAR